MPDLKKEGYLTDQHYGSLPFHPFTIRLSEAYGINIYSGFNWRSIHCAVPGIVKVAGFKNLLPVAIINQHGIVAYALTENYNRTEISVLSIW